MKNIFVRIVIFIISSLILIFSIYAFYIDISFSITKKETRGEILEIANQGEYDPLLVKVSYYNEFRDQSENLGGR